MSPAFTSKGFQWLGTRRRGGAFTPLKIPGLQAWWRLSDASVVLGNVASLTDLSGNGYTVSAAGAAQPVYTASNPDFNDYPSLRFDGVANNLLNSGALANALCGGNDSPFTLYMCIRLKSVSASIKTITAASEAASSTLYDISSISTATTQSLRQANDVQTNVTGGVAAINTTYLLRKFFTGTTTTIKLNGTVTINGAAQNNATMGASLNRFCLGGVILSGAAALLGNFEFVDGCCASGIVDAATDLRVGRYYGNRYGFSANT